MEFGSDVVFGVLINSRGGPKMFLPIWPPFSKWPPNLPNYSKDHCKMLYIVDISSLICKSFIENVMYSILRHHIYNFMNQNGSHNSKWRPCHSTSYKTYIENSDNLELPKCGVYLYANT